MLLTGVGLFSGPLMLTMGLAGGAAAASEPSPREIRFVWRGFQDGLPHSWGVAEVRRVEQTVRPGRGVVSLTRLERQQVKPAATIVLAANPTRSAQIAAAELNHYVEKITGVRLPVATDESPPFAGPKVLVGSSALTRALGLNPEDFQPQEYLIRTYGEMLVLMGHDEAEYGLTDYEGSGFWPGFRRGPDWSLKPNESKGFGSVYAVDTFLEKCGGVRWYMPGDLGEVCPRQSVLAVRDLDIRARPWTHLRHIYLPNMLDYFHFKGSGRPLLSYTQVHGPRGWRDLDLWKLRLKIIGSEAFACNHSLIAEWFQRRFPDKPHLMAKGYDRPTQLCLTEPELLRIVVNDADEYFSGRSNYERAIGDYFPVMPHDTSDYCRCARCQALLASGRTAVGQGFWSGTSSNYVWWFVNEAAKAIKARHPGKWVSCCAYARYTLLPTNVTLEDNVAVMLCRVLVEGLKEPAYVPFYQEQIRRWSQAVKRWYLWEYFDHIQGNGMECMFPGVFLHRIAEDMRFLHQHGCRGVFNELNMHQSAVPNYAQDHLNVYIYTKLLDDIGLDVDAALDEYARLFYGPAAQPMKRFFVLNEQRFTDPANWRLDPEQSSADWERICPPAVLAQFKALIDEAARLAVEEPYATRVRLMAEAVYGMMEKNCLKVHRAAGTTRVRAVRVTDPARDLVRDTNHIRTFWTIAGDPTETRTEAWVGYDDQHLYVRVVCHEEHMEQIKAAIQPGGDTTLICTEDCVELFIDAGRTRREYVQLLANPNGALRQGRYPGGDFTLSTGTTVTAVRGPDRWTLDFTIPLAKLTAGQGVRPGQVWGLNICRDRGRPGVGLAEQWTCWSPTFLGFHQPARFGTIVFE